MASSTKKSSSKKSQEKQEISLRKSKLGIKPNIPVPDMQQIMGGNVLFSNQGSEEEVFHQNDLIQLFPFGVSLTPDVHNPFVLLKDKALDMTLPVAVHPIEASTVLNLGNRGQQPYNPHLFLIQILDSLDIKILQCVFVQLKGARQFVRIYFQGHQMLNSIKLPADQVISLCVSLNIPLFATKQFINQSKLLNVQIEGVAQNLLDNQKLLIKNSSYIQ